MFAPGVPDVMKEFNSNNEQLASFVVSIYILGYAFGPLAVAPLSELYGRLPIYHVCNILFVVFTIACALSTNLSMLIGFRFLEGLFGSCPLTIGGGTIADMIVQEKRGGVIAIWALGPLMGPVVGPVTGGYLSQAKGWRWVFWVIAMAVSNLFPFPYDAMLIYPGRRHLHFRPRLPPRNLPSDRPRAQSRTTTERDWQRKSHIQTEVSAHTSSTLQGLHHPANEISTLLAHRPRAINIHGRRLWIPLLAVYDYHGSL